jgi:3-methyladenine DNA glycosylase AlkD
MATIPGNIKTVNHQRTDKYKLNFQKKPNMHVKEILSQLQALSNEKMIALNTKNGAGKNQFGVKLGDIRTLANKIKTNHQLGLDLWATKNVDAQLLACLTMKPKDLSKDELDTMVKSIDLPQVADWFNAYIIKDHPEKEQLREAWLNSSNKWAARSGWSLTAGKIARSADGLDLEKILDRIESEMPTVAPEIKWTMNTALAYIGIHHAEHRKRAMDIGEKLGIYRDYPVSKGCTSPFAPIWITEMVSRQSK